MKKLTVLLAVAFVMCVPEWSCAESQKPVNPDKKPDEAPVVPTPEYYVIPSWSIEQCSTLRELERALEEKVVALERVTQDMGKIAEQATTTWAAALANCQIEKAIIACALGGAVLSVLMPHLDYTTDPPHCRLNINEEELARYLRRSKDITSYLLDTTGKTQGGIELPAMLFQVDKARSIMRSSLLLFDEAIQIIESKKQ